MKWYGQQLVSLKNYLPRRRKYLIKKFKKIGYKIWGYKLAKTETQVIFKTHLYIPSAWNSIIFHPRNSLFCNCYIYSNNYFCYVPFPTTNVFYKYYKSNNVLSLYYFFKNNYDVLFWKTFKDIFFSFTSIFFKKIKFKGKGYYLFKNKRNTLAPQMGYSHRIRMYAYNTRIKFVAKTVVLFYGLNKQNIIDRTTCFFWIKPINVFTGRGIRFAKQIVYRKVGKISSYR